MTISVEDASRLLAEFSARLGGSDETVDSEEVITKWLREEGIDQEVFFWAAEHLYAGWLIGMAAEMAEEESPDMAGHAKASMMTALSFGIELGRQYPKQAD